MRSFHNKTHQRPFHRPLNTSQLQIQLVVAIPNGNNFLLTKHSVIRNFWETNSLACTRDIKWCEALKEIPSVDLHDELHMLTRLVLGSHPLSPSALQLFQCVRAILRTGNALFFWIQVVKLD